MTHDDMRAVELLRQLQALSPEGVEAAVRMTLRLPNGALVGEALLSADAVEALSDSVMSLNAYRAAGDLAPHVGLLPALDPADTAELLGEIDAFLAGGGDGRG